MPKNPRLTPSVLLDQGLQALVIDLQYSTTLMAYLDQLQRWNRTHNLTAIRSPEEMVTLHLLDSLSVLRHIGDGPLADLGSGGGLPGIPLAIIRPDLHVSLIESNGKKCAFLRQCQRELRLQNLEIIQSRGETVQREAPFAAVISRAFSSLADFVSISRSLVGDGGRLLAMKGQLPKGEIEALPAGIESSVHRLSVPGLDAERHLIELSLPAAR